MFKHLFKYIFILFLLTIPTFSFATPICAIKWDAWYSTAAGAPALSTAATLSAPQWQYRAPVHFTVSNNQLVPSISQTIIDADITFNYTYAPKLCWAYLTYGASGGPIDLTNSMMLGLATMRTSTIKSEVNYALMVDGYQLGATGNYASSVTAIANLVADSNYQSVTISSVVRPLIFIYWDSGFFATYWGSSYTNLAAMITSLRSTIVAAGKNTPYIVLVDAIPNAETERIGIGADAISTYSGPGAATAAESYTTWLGSYSTPSNNTVEGYWAKQCAATAAQCVPTLMTNWDTRPRKERPPTFTTGQRAWSGDSIYVVAPTNTQLNQEITDFKSFCASTASNNSSAVLGDNACIGLIYSYDEHDEGGSGLGLEIGDTPSTSRLSAIGSNLP